MKRKASEIIRKTLRYGEKIIGDNNINIYYLEGEEKDIYIIAGRKVGNSVKRNKLKRWTREAFTKNKPLMKNYSIIVNYKPGFDKYEFNYIKDYLFSVCKNASILIKHDET